MEKIKDVIGKVKKIPQIIKSNRKAKAALALTCAAAVALAVYRSARPGRAQTTGFESVGTRTVTLHPGTISETVTVTGTVESARTVNVSCDMSGYTVKQISVQVGDEVSEGQAIALLDTADLLESIEKEKEKISSNTSSAQSAYDSALQRQDSARRQLSSAQRRYNTAKAAADKAKSAFDTAVSAVSVQQAVYDNAREEFRRAQNRKNAALARLNKANADRSVSAEDKKRASDSYDEALKKYDEREKAKDSAQRRLESEKEKSSYRNLEAEYNRAQSRLTSAANTLSSRQKTYDSARSACDSARQALENSSTSEELEKLYENYEKCTIKATASGTITRLNVREGDMASGTLAVIQDTENLKISTSFEEYDVQNIEIGMECVITSDANDKTLSGYVSQISPTASADMNSSGTFDAEITIDGTDHGLLIGMNAKAEVIVTRLENVYSVPVDAVGTDENGAKVIYVQSGHTFEPLEVTTGMETDYYIQIISDRLYDGMVVRASANADESEAVVFNE